MPEDLERTQDFLMIDQPLFVANVEGYWRLIRIIRDDDSAAPMFFSRPNQSPEAQQRNSVTGHNRPD